MAKNTNVVTINADSTWQAVSTGVKGLTITLLNAPAGGTVMLASAAVVGDLTYATDEGHPLSVKNSRLDFTPGAPVFAKIVGGTMAGVTAKLVVTAAV